jgi:DNA-directed RNA polymerase
MIQDFELGIEVNLNSQTEKDKPKDIYTRIVKSINNELNKIGEEELEYNKLAFIKFDRKILKQSIMTKVYNVTNFGITQQIKSKLDSVKILDDKENDNILRIQNLLIKNLKHKEKVYYLAPTIEGGQINLTQKDLYKIATVINNQIFVLFPSLNKIYSYFIEITKLMLKLELPMNWMTPTGVKFIQHYNKTTENLIAIRMFGKTNKIVLREKLNKINKVKQIQAIIPNIIHSLDATHLINIINNFENYKFNHLITIHDCFGTLPNHMEILNFLVKKEFILLYSQNKFLEKFHKRIIDTIKDNNIEIIYEKKKAIKVIINDTEIKIPKVPSLGQLDFLKIKESKYMIS